MNAPLLVELFCEELPPKALKKLGDAFAEGVRAKLQALGFLEADSVATAFATPRRLAVRIANVRERSPDTPKKDKVLPISVAFAADGKPQPPLLKKLAALGLSEADIPKLTRAPDGKAEALFYESVAPGQPLAAVLQGAVEEAIAKLPIPKVMSYQLADLSTVQFVRPAHHLVALHGAKVVPITILGLKADQRTLGHRFVSRAVGGLLTIASADSYETDLEHNGGVIASFDARRAKIVRDLQARAGQDVVIMPDALLDEVTALVEWPVVVEGHFEETFLDVPQECLILTMQLNQKYFALSDQSGKLRNRFLLVSNLQTEDESLIRGGNERVLRARLADAKFFYDTDRKQRLDTRLEGLKSVVYHNKLGSTYQRVERIRKVARYVAEQIGADIANADRAALLAKCDLLTGMVGEFPELQGIMGAYYARHDGESADVCEAVGLQYAVRIEDGAKPSLVALANYIAERAEVLVGIWGIGLQPTGEKDPFALRRAALGLIRGFELAGASTAQSGTPSTLDLNTVLAYAATTFEAGVLKPETLTEVTDFIFERYRNQLAGVFDRAAVDAVIALRPALQEVVARVRAVIEFSKLPEAESLAAANKRIGNILKKAEGTGAAKVDATLFAEAAEKALAQAVDAARPNVDALYAHGDYAASLSALAALRAPVDAFFNDVMVMADDPAVRANRIALLGSLHDLMNRVADLAKLAG